MPYQLDLTTGTKATPTRVPFPEGKKQAVVCVAFVDASTSLTEGVATACQGAMRGTLQANGYDVSDARFAFALQADEELPSYVDFGIHVGKDYPDEAPEPESNPDGE